ncbi:hypothetical protein GDO78_002540 [Eleutherodactylus coqui]|uniref:Uncharacterized protein n=1 Tax=Eleutherodactylus coqui TaxID=57060 RepID=A0A8J6EXX5_ELECQ|nr:hypothetical protein GDO78_002540 [Eleutherodactylus coqui]
MKSGFTPGRQSVLELSEMASFKEFSLPACSLITSVTAPIRFCS